MSSPACRLRQEPLFPVPIKPPKLTLITDTSRYGGETFFNAVQQALLGGVDAVLIREKQLTSAKLLALASRLRQITYASHARLFIHSQADVAAAVNADGVHLASADVHNIAAVRQWMHEPHKTVSVSCHNGDELGQAATSGADFAMPSPVFPTVSHPGSPHLGIDVFQKLASETTLPVVALGGISPGNCDALQASNMAVIGAIFGAIDPARAAHILLAATKKPGGDAE